MPNILQKGKLHMSLMVLMDYKDVYKKGIDGKDDIIMEGFKGSDHE